MLQLCRSRLPPELNDMVIDHLKNEKAALSSTALVNKSWLVRSRVHLFRVITVTAEFARFAAFLQDRKHLHACIQRLTLQGEAFDSDLGDTTDVALLEPTILAFILAQLPRLHHLCLHDVSFRTVAPILHMPRSLFKIPEVTLMNVGSCEDTTNDVLHVLGLFSEIRALNILAVEQCLDDNDVQARTDDLHIPHSLSVSSLKVEDVPYELYMQIFRHTNSVHTLKNLEMECGDIADVEALAELLQDASSSVESLSLNLTQCFLASVMSEDDSEALQISVLSSRAVCEALGSGISSCTNLKSLEIGISLDRMGEREAWKTIPGILHSVPESSIRRLDIAIACDEYAEPFTELELDWEPLSDVLKKFSNVKDVTFGHVPGTSWVFSPEEQDIVRKNLPDLARRGVLRTTWRC